MLQTGSKSLNRIAIFIAGVLLIAFLYFARDVLIPLALAVLLSFVLSPVVQRLQRWRIPRVPATLIVTAAAFLILGIVGWTIILQLMNLAEDLPRYNQNLRAKIQSIQLPINRTKETVKELSDELNRENPSASRVQKVEIAPSPLTTPQILRGAIGPVVKPIGTAAVVIVFVIFMLLNREDLRDRFIRLTGAGQLHLTTQALDDAAGRVSRFILMQFIINGIMGACIAAGLFFIGVPNSILWGFLSAALRFIPYLGPWMAAAMPVTLSLAVFNTWTPVVMTCLLFVILEIITNNVIEPWLYGTHTGVSPVALIVAAVFWSWLWGIFGLLLSTPLTVCLVVMGKYIPQMKFLDILLGDQPVLEPGERFYQRLLAMNPEEAEAILQKEMEETSLTEICDTILLPALNLVKQDRLEGGLDEEKQRDMLQSVRQIMDDLFNHSGDQKTAGKQDNNPLVWCLPAQDQADEIAALLFVRILRDGGVNCRLGSAASLAGEVVNEMEKQPPAIICISAVPPSAVLPARYLCKRIRAGFPKIPILVGLWNAKEDVNAAADRLRSAGCDKVVTKFTETQEQVRELLQHLLMNPRGNVPLLVPSQA